MNSSYACTEDLCSSYEELLLPAPGTTIPANSTSVVISVARSKDDLSEPELPKILNVDGDEIPFEAESIDEHRVELKFLKQLTPNSQYQVVYTENDCVRTSEEPTVFYTGVEEELPDHIGIAITDYIYRRQEAEPNECLPSNHPKTTNRVELRTTNSNGSVPFPWREVLTSKMFVDGKLWDETSKWEDFVPFFVGCNDDRTPNGVGLSEGQHTFYVEHTIWGTDYKLNTGEDTFYIDCQIRDNECVWFCDDDVHPVDRTSLENRHSGCSVFDSTGTGCLNFLLFIGLFAGFGQRKRIYCRLSKQAIHKNRDCQCESNAC